MKHFDLSGALPPHQQQVLLRWYNLSLGILATTLILMVMAHGYALHKKNHLKKQSAQTRDAQTQLTEIKTQIVALKQQQNPVATQEAPNPTKQQIPFAGYLECLTHDLPNDLRLEAIEYENHKKITLTGVTRSISQLTDFCTHLRQDHHFSNCSISSLKQQKNQPTYFDFVLTTILS